MPYVPANTGYTEGMTRPQLHTFRLGDPMGYCTLDGCGLPAANAVHQAPQASSGSGTPLAEVEAPFPALPYDGGTSSGWSGTDTSRARATENDASGSTARRQAWVLARLATLGEIGITVAELRAEDGWSHHGTASGVLSNLHAGDHIAMLDLVRGGCHVYVDKHHIAGRGTRSHGRNRLRVTDVEQRALDTLRQQVERGMPAQAEDVAVLLGVVDRLAGKPA